MSYADFWPRYLAAHADRRSRALHYCGTFAAVALLGLGVVARDWRWLVVALIAGHGPPWLGHIGFERTRPAPFSHPVSSRVSDLPMLGLLPTCRRAGERSRRKIGR